MPKNGAKVATAPKTLVSQDLITGKGRKIVEGETVLLEPGDSWLVPEGAEHTYRILEAFTAVEATAPPAR